MITENLSTLKIHKLTQAQYDRELEAGNLEENALYLTPDEVIPIKEGGTGATTAAGALTNLGLTATAAELNIMDGVTATAAEINKLDGITATTTELNYVDGVTSNIQTQLDGKADASHAHGNITNAGAIGTTSGKAVITTTNGVLTTGTVSVASGGTGATTAAGALTNLGLTATAAELNIMDGVTATTAEINKLDGLTATTAELNYVDGVTSNVQTQLDAKQATITGAATTIASSNLTASRALVSNSSGKVTVSAVTATELGYLDGVTSNVQTQLDGKAASSHSHSILPSSQYGSSLPTAGTAGRIFFKKV